MKSLGGLGREEGEHPPILVEARCGKARDGVRGFGLVGCGKTKEAVGRALEKAGVERPREVGDL